jgi:hypothetical protein
MTQQQPLGSWAKPLISLTRFCNATPFCSGCFQVLLSPLQNSDGRRVRPRLRSGPSLLTIVPAHWQRLLLARACRSQFDAVIAGYDGKRNARDAAWRCMHVMGQAQHGSHRVHHGIQPTTASERTAFQHSCRPHCGDGHRSHVAQISLAARFTAKATFRSESTQGVN